MLTIKEKTKLRSLIAKETVTGLHNHLHDLAYIPFAIHQGFLTEQIEKSKSDSSKKCFTSKYKTKGTTWT